METKKIKVDCKSTEIISILVENFAGKMNLARIKFLGKFLCALCKVQSISYEKLKTAFESEATTESILRRIQRFMAEYVLDTDIIARLIFKMLPHKPPYLYCVRSTRYVIGVFIDENMNSIRILNNGRRAKSFFKYGLEYITEIFLNPLKVSNIEIFKFLSCT